MAAPPDSPARAALRPVRPIAARQAGTRAGERVMAAERGKRQPADTQRAMLGWGDTVRVLPYRAPHSGEEGTVQLDGGDLLVTVEFSGGTRENYWEDELKRTAAAPRNPRALWD